MSGKSILKAVLYLVILCQTALLLPLCWESCCINERRSEAYRMVTMSNMKVLHAVLERFRTEYGSYPCDATAELIAAKYPELQVEQLRGDSANAYLRQLFCMPEAPDERLFYGRLIAPNGKESTREGDNQLQDKALEPGENAMGYVLRRGHAGQRESVQADGERKPLLICSVYPSHTPYAAQELKLDGASFRGHILVLYTDGSVRDHVDNFEEDEENDSIIRPVRSMFPALPDGEDGATQHIVLSPICPETEPQQAERSR